MVDKKIFVQTLGDNYKPSHKEDAINGLPAIIFNYSTSPSDSDYLERKNTGVEDFISRNQADAFIVAKNGNQIVNTFFYWSQPDFALTPFYNYYTIFDFGGGIERYPFFKQTLPF